MKKKCCLLVLFILGMGAVCFAQTRDADTQDSVESSTIQDDTEVFPLLDMVPQQAEDQQDQNIFANAPQWVRDIRRAEIVLFGTLPFTVFFSRTFMDLYRTASNDWDRRYAPWPFTSAGAVTMTNDELKIMFAIAVSASLAISIADYILVSRKRKAASVQTQPDN